LQTKTILLAILLGESENEITIAAFLRGFQQAVGDAVETLEKVPPVKLAFAWLPANLYLCRISWKRVQLY
jgi:hypothetical protein